MAEGEHLFSWWRLGAPHLGAVLPLLLFLSPGFVPTSSTYLYSEVIEPLQLETNSHYNSKLLRGGASGQVTVGTLRREEPKQNGGGEAPLFLVEAGGAMFGGGAAAPPLPQPWGHIQFGSLTYEIQPVENSSTFQHFIYRRDPQPQGPCVGIAEDGAGGPGREVRMVRAEEDPDVSSRQQADLNRTVNRYLEYYAVADKSTFLLYGGNETALVSVVFHMMHHVYTIFLPLGLHVYLVGMEIWTDKNYVTLHPHELSMNLNAFYEYVRYKLRHHEHFDHAGLMTNCSRLSNCSRLEYLKVIQKPEKTCLLDKPAQVFIMKECGNGVIDDEDEQCDCGIEEECRKNECCRKDCKFRKDIDCLYGLCCEKCKFSETGTRCREAASECDLPEFCNGTSYDCPTDVYKQDGTPCGNHNHCFLGRCLDLHTHCKALFGPDAREAPLSCFKEMNTRGDRFGNCGKDGSVYRKCLEKDVLCGRVQCVNVGKISRVATRQDVLQTPVEGATCWGTEFDLGEDVYDLGAVQDGTSCGPDKICLNRSCVDVAVLDFDCDPSVCRSRGVCNSNRNCHCSYGWAPPLCTDPGFGGSIDSGPPPPYQLPTIVIVGLFTLTGLVVLVAGVFISRHMDVL
ncbi:disintegrin and metalloproteinase domain-containing protein 20-like [Crotalus adamanteus]|uniref:Disintegrin and metalloproteinase domain-containing protein 20-like n=1 Tax=Crotalus adamanteus TaxID=8729 RepID=A0AAW1BLL2_CROAD